MPTVLQFRRGTTSQNNSFTGSAGELSIDTDLDVIRVHDGSTPGGFALVGQNCVQTIANKTYTGTSLSVTGNVIGNNVSAISNVYIGASSNTHIYMQGDATHIDNLSPTGNIVLVGNATSTSSFEALKVLSNGGVAFTGDLLPISVVNGAFGNYIGNIGNTSYRFSGMYANMVYATSTSAQYADLAEMYVSDSNYAPGTVVEFGGKYEITISSASHSTAVAGIVSTNPSYLMNSEQTGEHVLAVALTGRVPCRVQGPVRKGDVLVASATPGVAQRIGMNWQPGCVLGKSMQVIESAEIRTIEVAVGRT
jgi:hypothetical protein